METLLVKLWKYDRIGGYWHYVRDCYLDQKDAWLTIFRNDEPKEFFKASKRRPQLAPKELRS